MNTGGPAFPQHGWSKDPEVLRRMKDQGGMTMLDWYAWQETIGDEELSAGICDHFAGPRPSGNWSTNPVEWYEWEARWRAGVKYTRASAMLAEKARREAADHSGDGGKTVDGYIVDENKIRPQPQQRRPEPDHSPDAGKMEELQEANRELVEALDAMISGWVDPFDDNDDVAKARAILAKHKGAA